MTNTNLSLVWETYEAILDTDVLEDRREYSFEDIQKMYDLNDGETQYLLKLIASNFNPNASSVYRSTWEPDEAMKLAQNITEAIHQELDGWEPHEKVIITLFLHDLAIAQKVS